MYIIYDGTEWNHIVNQCPQADFYHTYDYHQISKKEDEQTVLLKYTEGESCILLPLLIRKIEGTDLKDATSVYGYAGPLSKGVTKDFNNDLFEKRLNKF